MTTRTYAAEPNVMAGAARVRAFRSCMAQPVVTAWLPILGTDSAKHGRPRRQEVSHQ